MIPIRQWLRSPGTSAWEKALYAAVTLSFFSLSLGPAPATITAALAAGIWLFSGLALKQRCLYTASCWWSVLAMILLPWIGLLYSHDTTGIGMDYAKKTY